MWRKMLKLGILQDAVNRAFPVRSGGRRVSAPRRALLAMLPLLLAAPMHGQEPGRIVRGLSFTGNHALEDETLAAAIVTTNSSWFARNTLVRWIGLGEKRYFDETEFQRDVLRITLLYRKVGFLEVEVDTIVRREPENVYITFAITENEPIILDSLDVAGIDSVGWRQRLARSLPLQAGDPFNRILLEVSADTLVRRLRDRGYPDAVAFQSFEVDKEARRAEATIELEPGTIAVIGPVDVSGTQRVDTSVVRGLLATRPGQRFSQEDLFRSQRNLYRSELFGFASVGVDTAAYKAGSGTVPLAVRVTEGRFRRARGSFGYATEDCLRFGAGITFRNFLGGGRIFDVSGRVSNVGVGTPVDWGLEESICPRLKEDTLGSGKINYNITTALRRPAFLSPHNTLTGALFAERRSEFQVYRREEVGGSVGLSRETLTRIPLGLTYRLSYGFTEASPASFCASLDACSAEDIARLSEKLWLGTLTGSAAWPRVNNPIDPSRGRRTRVEATVSSQYLGSSSGQTFGRLVAERSWYTEVTRRSVLSFRLRGGISYAPLSQIGDQSVHYIPPEHRFYAGGPNDVRGYELNELGPINYVVVNDSFPVDSIGTGVIPEGDVRFSPIGGNMLLLGNVELRIPSPIWSNFMRIVGFVDAGMLYERGQTVAAVRVTPGVGLRFVTPLGPARVDVGYNPYGRQSGTLYLSRQGELFKITDDFDPGGTPNRYTLHFAVGQPF